jgi:23S rRNA pseudouridine2605 synthase
MKQRIQKVLAAAGVASRRNIEEMVRQGRISVNGHVFHDLPVLIDPAKDKVEVDGERVRLTAPAPHGHAGLRAGPRGKDHPVTPRMYFLLYKPKGVYSTNVAQGAQVRAIDLLPQDLGARLYPVGRLDADSKGLLLLTNDGELTNQLTHPRYGVAKTYRAVVDGYVQPQVAEQIQQGVWLADKRGGGFKTGRSRLRIVKRTRDKTVLEITLREGRNRQVRRVLARLGHKVRDLTRIKMGPLTLEGLSPGRSRQLTPKEVRLLKRLPGSQQAGKQSADRGQ